MMVTSSVLSSRTRLKNDLSPRRIAGVSSAPRRRYCERIQSYPGRVEVRFIDGNKARACGSGQQGFTPNTSGKFHFPQVVIATEDEEVRPITVPLVQNPHHRDIDINIIDLVALATDAHRSSSSMTRHKVIERVVERDYPSPRRPHTVPNKDTNTMANMYVNPCISVASSVFDDSQSTAINVSREEFHLIDACVNTVNGTDKQQKRTVSHFPDIDKPSIKNVTSSTAHVQIPDNPPMHFQQVAREANTGGLSSHYTLAEYTRKENRWKGNAWGPADKETYFMNIDHLRARIVRTRVQASRRGKRGRHFNSREGEVYLHIPKEIDIEPTLAELREGDRVVEPPIMSGDEMRLQHLQPRFYAGTEFKYEIPKTPSIVEVAQRAAAMLNKVEKTSHVQLRGIEAVADYPEIVAWRKARDSYENEKRAKWELAAKRVTEARIEDCERKGDAFEIHMGGNNENKSNTNKEIRKKSKPRKLRRVSNFGLQNGLNSPSVVFKLEHPKAMIK